MTYAVVLLAIAGLGAGRYYGLDGVIATRVAPRLRTVLMSGEPAPTPVAA